MRALCFPLLVGALLLQAGCSKAPKIEGTVTDLYNKPIEGALVVVLENNHQATSDGAGHFFFEVEQGKTINLKGGHEGYVASVIQVQIPADDKTPLPRPHLELWPDPKDPGFYGRGTARVVPFPAAPVVAMGTDLKEIHGIRDLPKTQIYVGDGPARIQFKSTLRAEEISRMDLSLHALKYVENTPILGILGEQSVDAQLWVADQEVPFELQAMEGKDVYLITTKDKLPKGKYAFQYQDLLSHSELGALEKVPDEMRVVYPFEIL